MNNNSVSWMRVGGIYAYASYRLVISALVIGGYYLALSQGVIMSPIGDWVHVVLSLVAAYAITTYLYTARQSKQTTSFLNTTLVLDITSLSVVIFLLGSHGPALFPLYLLITFAYGLANGESYLQGASALSTLGFTLVYLVTPEWNNPVLAIGLLASLFYLPLMLTGTSRGLLAEGLPVLAEQEPAATETEALTELSYELKTQINEVVTDSDQLLKQGLSAKKQHLTKAIANNSATALRLVKEVDDYARLSSGQHEYEAESTSLISIVRDVTATCSTAVEKKSLSYEAIFSPEMIYAIEACPREIRQALSHLIGNAVKYTDQGYVRLKVSSLSKQGRLFWRYEVSDSGKGIEDDQQKMVFEPFVRTKAGRSHTSRGLGLGTTIARLLVEGMGGEIGFSSESDKGTTFWFELPVVLSEAPLKNPESPVSVTELSLNSREKGVLMRLDQEGTTDSQLITLDALVGFDFYGVDSFLVGEYVTEQELFRLTDQLPDSDLPIPVIRYQRLQPDDMVIYTRQKFGDTLSVPASLEASQLAIILVDLARPETDSAVEKKKKPKEKLSVLIAEGSSGTRDILATMLVNKGHQIYLARNSVQAQDIVNGIGLDLILLDPDLTDEAFELALENRPPQSCLLITGRKTSKMARARLEGFSDGELHRPMQTDRLYAEIDRLFGEGNSASFNAEEKVQDQGKRKPLLHISHQVLNSELLEELEEVDSGSELLPRFIDRYIVDSEELFQALAKALVVLDIQSVKKLSEELESLSSPLGLEKLAEFCKRIRTIEQKDLVTRHEDLVSRLKLLYEEGHLALLDYRNNFDLP